VNDGTTIPQGLPNWPAFSSERLPTMVFDTRCEVLNAPDAKEQAVIKQPS